MAFAVKIDFCGLVDAVRNGPGATGVALSIRDSKINGSNESYQPQGGDGSYLLTDVFGEDSAPSNTYGLKADVSLAAGAIKLNKIVTITTGSGDTAVSKLYALEKVTIKTSAGSPVSIEASCQEIEDGATDANQGVYWIPAFSLLTRHEAQVLFNAFTMSGAGCHLTECSAELSCVVSKDDVAGVKISSDCNSGEIKITGTILSVAGNVPSVTVPSGENAAISLGNNQTSQWVLSKPPALSEENPEKAAKQYSFEVQMNLVKYWPTAENDGDE